MAWKALRSCPDDSAVMWALLGGELVAQRVDVFTSRLEHGRDRMLGQPVDLEVGMELPQLVGDRHVALGVAEPDRGGDVQRPAAARQGAGVGAGLSDHRSKPPAAIG